MSWKPDVLCTIIDNDLWKKQKWRVHLQHNYAEVVENLFKLMIVVSNDY